MCNRICRYLTFGLWIVMGLVMSCSQDGTTLSIHYVSIGVETFRAVTSENIEERGAACEVTKPSDVAEIKKIIESASPAVHDDDAFTNMAVRVKIVEKSRGIDGRLVAIIENHGPVRSAKGDQVLSGKVLDNLKRLVEGICKFSS